jgi:hypothetical protein
VPDLDGSLEPIPFTFMLRAGDLNLSPAASRAPAASFE